MPVIVRRGLRKEVKKVRSAFKWMRIDSQQRRHALVGSAYLWRMKRRFQIEFLKGRGLQPRHRVIDIGCGTLRGGLPLIAYLEPGHYFGLETREQVLKEARLELREANLMEKSPVLVQVDDIARTDLPVKADFCWAFSVIFHMTDAIVDDTFSFVAKHLAADCRFFANVNIGERPDGAWQGFPITWRPLAFYRGLAGRHGLSLSDIGALGDLGHVADNDHDEQRMLCLIPRS